METKKKIFLLYSGGLDSRLAAKLLTDKGYSVVAVFFQLPFSSGKTKEDEFLQQLNIPLEIIDCKKGEMLNAFLKVLKQPKYGRGAGYNPCTDCKLFMMNTLAQKAGEYGCEAIGTGEVPGQRPMSQTRGKMNIIEKNAGIKIIRPLEELGIQGRTRKKQIELAEKFGMIYPSPGGGCLLCEKALKKRFEVLVENNLIDDNTLPLSMIGRHFYFEDEQLWFVVGRDKEENDVIERFSNVIVSGKGKPAVFYFTFSQEFSASAKATAEKLQKAYEEKDRETIGYYSKWKM
ncbi:MAG: argininosuccinate synthase domain-containing protein [Bacteroidales bacterium]